MEIKNLEEENNLDNLEDNPDFQNQSEDFKKQLLFTKSLIEKARKGEHSKFEFIHNLYELQLARRFKLAQKALVKSFDKTARGCLDDYMSSVADDTDRVDILITYKQLVRCVAFYEQEMAIYDDMIKEYLCYIHSNHLMNTLMQIDRPEEDCVDWRKLPIVWPWQK